MNAGRGGSVDKAKVRLWSMELPGDRGFGWRGLIGFTKLRQKEQDVIAAVLSNSVHSQGWLGKGPEAACYTVPPSCGRFPVETRLLYPRLLPHLSAGSRGCKGLPLILDCGTTGRRLGQCPFFPLDHFLTCARIGIFLLHLEEAL